MTEYAVVNPATGEGGPVVPAIGDADLERAIGRCDTAYRSWGRLTPVSERAALVRRVGELHSEHREELASIIVREMGKPVEQALFEVDFCADIYSYVADTAELHLADEVVELRGEAAGTALVRSAPLGVLLGIMPWNFPAYQVARFAGPNLAIGNTILLKHAPQCPESAEFIANLFVEAGFPADAYVNVFATNQQVADVIADARVAGVSLTGSERAGRAVAELAGRHLKKVVLELGGSDPFLVLSTDDMDGLVDKAVAARLDNSGQACNAAKRFVVVESLYEDFLERFSRAFLAIRPGDPTDRATVLGPLSSAMAADRLAEQVATAVAHGATATSRFEREGTFFPPVVLTGVSPDNPAYRDEFFGPVATVHRAVDEADAVRLANDTPFGLGSYVFTTNEDQAQRVADQLEAGMVYVNAVMADGAEMPFGGVKRSGVGRELGRYGFGEFVNKKLIRVSG